MRHSKFLNIIILLIFCLSCQTNKTEGKKDNIEIESDGLKDSIEQEIKRFIITDSLSISKHASVYTLEIFNKDIRSVFTQKDTVIFISFFNCKFKEDYIGYKGVLAIDNYCVIIMDEQNVGSKFYDPQKLIDIPLDALHCIDDTFRTAKVFKIKNNKLREWGNASK